MTEPAGRAALVAALALLAAACEEGLPGREPLLVRSVSGARVDLTGTIWRGCRQEPGGSWLGWREVHGEEGAISFALSTYSGADCTGTATPGRSYAVYGEDAGDAPAGWTPAAPAGLADPVTATRVFLSGPGVGYDLYLLDDTNPAARVLYTADPRSPPDAQGFPTRLDAGGEEETVQ